MCESNVHPANGIDFSPHALRAEATSLLELAEWERGEGPITPEQVAGLQWAVNASDDDLRVIATTMLYDPELWEMFSAKALHAFTNKDLILRLARHGR